MRQSSDNIEYTVLSRNRTNWTAEGVTGDMQTALNAAQQLLADRACREVKVDKRFIDPTNKRLVTTTIMQRRREGGGNSGLMMLMVLVLLAVLGGAISFGVTYLLAGRYM
jgi:hypothetical protein